MIKLPDTFFRCVVVEVGSGDYQVVTPAEVMPTPDGYDAGPIGRYRKKPHFAVHGKDGGEGGFPSSGKFYSAVEAAIDGLQGPLILDAIREALSKRPEFSVHGMPFPILEKLIH